MKHSKVKKRSDDDRPNSRKSQNQWMHSSTAVSILRFEGILEILTELPDKTLFWIALECMVE